MNFNLSSGPQPLIPATQFLTPSQASQVRLNLGLGSVYTDSNLLPGLGRTLRTSQSDVVLQVIGDSTAQTAGWPPYFASIFSAKYPNYTTKLRFWDATNLAMPTNPYYESDSVSGVREWQFISRGVSLPDADFTCPTGDLDIRIQVNSSNWNPGTSQTLLAKQNAGNIGLRVVIASAGNLDIFWSNDGIANKSAVSTVTVASVLGASGTGWLRSVLDVDNGSTGYSAYFYTSSNGSSWNQLGNTLSGTGVQSVAAIPTATWTLGESAGSFATNHYIRGLELRDGISGRIVNPLSLDTWQIIASGTAFLSGGPTCEIVCATAAGQTFAYWTGNYSKAQVWGAPSYYLFNDGHNWTSSFGKQALAAWNLIASGINVIDPAGCIGVNGENPRNQSQYIQSPQKDAYQMAWASSRGLSYLDTAGLFLDSQYPLSTLISADGLHPSSTGYTLWSQGILDAIN